MFWCRYLCKKKDTYLNSIIEKTSETRPPTKTATKIETTSKTKPPTEITETATTMETITTKRGLWWSCKLESL